MADDLIKPLVVAILNAGTRIVDEDGIATPAFRQNYNNNLRNSALSNSDIGNVLERIVALNNLVTSVDAKVEAEKQKNSLANSYTNPTAVLTATSDGLSGSITIAAHARVYGDTTTVQVNGGTITGLPANKQFYVFYHDETRAGGAVTYLTTENPGDAAQVGDVHCCGAAYIAGEVDTGSEGVGGGGPGVPSGRYPRANQQ